MRYCRNKVILSIEGWLDTNSAPELGREIEALSDIESLILDFDKLEYIASAGLRIVVSAYKKLKSMNGNFFIIHVICNRHFCLLHKKLA